MTLWLLISICTWFTLHSWYAFHDANELRRDQTNSCIASQHVEVVSISRFVERRGFYSAVLMSDNGGHFVKSPSDNGLNIRHTISRYSLCQTLACAWCFYRLACEPMFAALYLSVCLCVRVHVSVCVCLFLCARACVCEFLRWGLVSVLDFPSDASYTHASQNEHEGLFFEGRKKTTDGALSLLPDIPCVQQPVSSRTSRPYFSALVLADFGVDVTSVDPAKSSDTLLIKSGTRTYSIRLRQRRTIIPQRQAINKRQISERNK